MGTAHFMASIGTDLGAGVRSAIYSWTKGERWRTLNPASGLEQRRIGNADVRYWKRPGDGKTMVVVVDLVCPNCQFPFSFKPKTDEEFGIDEDDLLTYRGRVECPARWPQYENGVPTGNWINCGWAAVIIDGRCHQINGRKRDGTPMACPVVQPGVDHNPHNCRCGGYPTDEERARLING